MGNPDTQDLSPGYYAYLEAHKQFVPSMFSYHHGHVRRVHSFSSPYVGDNSKSVFCHSLSHPGAVVDAFAWLTQLGAQYSCGSVTYLGQTR